jgi:hypothetical protein
MDGSFGNQAAACNLLVSYKQMTISRSPAVEGRPKISVRTPRVHSLQVLGLLSLRAFLSIVWAKVKVI